MDTDHLELSHESCQEVKGPEHGLRRTAEEAGEERREQLGTHRQAHTDASFTYTKGWTGKYTHIHESVLTFSVALLPNGFTGPVGR